jgi:hypothetical protein
MNFKKFTDDSYRKTLFKLGNQKISFRSSTSNLWLSILNSTYSSNIVGAYDFRDSSGTIINAKIGPNLFANGNVTFDSDGAVFTRSPNSYIESNTTISVTYPFTMVYVGKVEVLTFDDLVHMSVQSSKWAQTLDLACIFSRSSQGILGYNGVDNNVINYIPNNTEWYFIAISFFNGTFRYQVRKTSGNINGVLGAQSNPASFDGYIGIGAGLGSATSYNFNGNMRLAMFIRQGFTTEAEMNYLYSTVVSGPAKDIVLI